MKKLFILLVCLCAAKNIFAWGQKGHDVVAYIAECHLTPEAAEKIDKVLEGHSLVYYANWMDIASHQPNYAYSKTWHYLNIDEGMTIETMPKDPKGDILTAVTAIVNTLKTGGLEPDEEALQLKMLIHLLGDMHCPLHTGHRSDSGANQIAVNVFSTPTNLHSAWDTLIPEAAHKWAYTEWQSQLDRLSDDEAVLIQSGDLLDWIKETNQICSQVYTQSPNGITISYDYIDANTPIIEMQFLRGGYRLARVLNEIYQ